MEGHLIALRMDPEVEGHLIALRMDPEETMEESPHSSTHGSRGGGVTS